MRNAVCILCAVVIVSTLRAPAADPAVSDEAALDWAKKLEVSMNTGDSTLFDQSFNLDAFDSLVVKDLDLPPDEKKGFLAGMSNTISGFGKSILTALGESGSYKLLRVRRIGNSPQPIFRMITSGGTNYHEFRLVQANGKVAIADVYVYLAGDWMSAIMRRAALPLVAQANRGFLDKLVGSESDYIKNLDTILKIIKLSEQNKAAEAIRIYKTLPASVQNDKNILIIRYKCAAAIQGQEYADAMDAIKKAYPNDAGLNLILIDSYFLSKQYDEAMKCCDLADKNLGGDPYMNYLRGSIMLASKKFPEAKKFMKQATKEEPTLDSPYWGLVSISLEEKDFKETGKILSEIESVLHIPISDLTKLPLYAEYVKSPEYKEWVRGHAK